ncbi:MAG: hypothetical protein IJC81_04675, partial [Clostridia bacterium]|nr:hypothetical protein [Clostridia bacterium]
HLGCFYHEKGKEKEAKEMLHQSLALAQEIDNREKNFVCEEGLLCDLSIEKDRLPNLTSSSLADKLESYIVRHKKIQL